MNFTKEVEAMVVRNSKKNRFRQARRGATANHARMWKLSKELEFLYKLREKEARVWNKLEARDLDISHTLDSLNRAIVDARAEQRAMHNRYFYHANQVVPPHTKTQIGLARFLAAHREHKRQQDYNRSVRTGNLT